MGRRLIDKDQLISDFEKLEESYENAGLPSWMGFSSIIDYIDCAPEVEE